MIKLSGDIWERWIARRAEIEKLGKYDLARLFMGQEADGFREANRKVLYTGKATAGPFNFENANNDYAAQGLFPANHGAFWSFARRLSGLTSGDAEKLENVAWSNICKIGTVRGNPNDELAELQRSLAVETLKLEWAELGPTLIVCVAEGYQEHFIYEALGVTQNLNDGFLTTPPNAGEPTIHYRPALGGQPAFLWLRHPQGKSHEYLKRAENIAKFLLR